MFSHVPIVPWSRCISIMLAWMMLAALFLSLPLPSSAREAAPGGPGLAALGLPELRIEVTDTSVTVPDEVLAGRTLVVLDNQGSPDGPAAITDVNILQLPEGVSLDDLNALTGLPGELPAWFAEIDSLGGFNVAAGKTGYAVLDLEPGEWAVGVGDAGLYELLTVTGDSLDAGQAVDPAADLSVALVEHSLGLPERIAAGPQVWHVINTGDQPHEMVLVRLPELLAVDHFVTVMTLPEGEPAPEGLPDPATLVSVVDGVKTLSAGRELWMGMDLAPGIYAAYCATPDPVTGEPHALLGEVHIFTVGEAG